MFNNNILQKKTIHLPVDRESDDCVRLWQCQTLATLHHREALGRPDRHQQGVHFESDSNLDPATVLLKMVQYLEKNKQTLI